MRASIRLLTLLCLYTFAPAIAAGPDIRILATDPANGQDLPVGGTLYVRIAYESDEPLRFRTHGLLGGTAPTASTRTNPAPAYPAGRGEAIAWIEYTGPALIDEIVVEASTHSWQVLESISEALDIEWRQSATSSQRAAWVAPLSEAQQQMTRESLARHTEGSEAMDWVILLMGWSVPGYFILQFALAIRWHGGWRRIALVPLWGTVPVILYTLFALLKGSNLWPLVMLFTLPWAFVYLLVLLVLRRFMRKSGH